MLIEADVAYSSRSRSRSEPVYFASLADDLALTVAILTTLISDTVYHCPSLFQNITRSPFWQKDAV